MIPSNYKLVSFFVKSLNGLFNDLTKLWTKFKEEDLNKSEYNIIMIIIHPPPPKKIDKNLFTSDFVI